MPLIQALPTWLAWNNANFTSPTGITDVNTGQPISAGGLNAGDYFDATDSEAANASYTTNGTLYAGRYRLVHVDSGATAANVATGTIGFLRAGTSVVGVIALTQGISQAAGTYVVNATGGGGTGASIQVVVGSGGTLSGAPTVITGGFNYTSVPTFTLTGTGGTPATFIAQLSTTPNDVTSADIATVKVRPVVFLNSITPGNYGFVQELGTATVLGAASGSNQAQPAYVNSSTNGLVVATDATSASPVAATIGLAIDHPENASLFKIILQYVPVVQG